ncbi:unnamed protein product [Vitrella brassicaformis CCMP3155]|uniref:Major facilitator superfamily (MFS) profile domain-containing protein n=1 Tax=Vitrella brassicaformis (strain CCMP3155) TaxID=1169540 RepID=A0A0G4H7Z6_VITBC|nr:unnamed protein product [Vitrella brassicaformis CCMP3155]|eukprot:CEM40057.1 unnamed protein product [Vitrella brassicaformis CCMP3155]
MASEETLQKPPAALPFYREARFWVVSISLFHLLISSGLGMGWGATTIMLLEANVYSHMCTEESFDPETGSCEEEAVHLNLIFTVCVAFQMVLGLPLGIILDRIGPKMVFWMHLTLTVGAYLVGLGPKGEGEFDYTFLGFFCLIAPGTGVALYATHCANLYPNNYGLVTAFFSTVFGTSSIVFAAFQLIISETPVTFDDMFLYYAIVLTLFLPFLAMQPMRHFDRGDKVAFSIAKGGFYRIPPTTAPRKHAPHLSQTTLHFDLRHLSAEQLKPPPDEEEDTPVMDPRKTMSDPPVDLAMDSETSEVRAAVNAVVGTVPKAVTAQAQQHQQHGKGAKDYDAVIKCLGHPKTRLGKVVRQMCTLDFMLITIYLTIWYFIFQFYLGSVTLQLREIVKSEGISDVEGTTTLWTQVFSWVAPMGWMSALGVGAIADRYGWTVSLIAQIVVGWGHLICGLIRVLALQPLTFIFYTFSQEATYALCMALWGDSFGFEDYCTLAGFGVLVMGIPLLFITPIVSAVLDDGGDFSPLSIAFLAISVVTLVLPYYLSRPQKKAALASSRRAHEGGGRGEGEEGGPDMSRRSV